MTQLGGPAAINGFLYQMLHHIDLIASVHWSKRGPNTEQIILEPKDGGDALAEELDFLLVEQYKTRSDRTWSVSEVIEVLKNLRPTVKSHKNASRYRFVTNGKRGRLDELESFLDRIRLVQSPVELDSMTKRKFSNNRRMPDLEFFYHIESNTRSREIDVETNDSASIFHLLSNFEMEFNMSAERLTRRIDLKLRQYVPDLGTESCIRDRLVVKLMRHLSIGSVTLNREKIERMFCEVDLSPQRLNRLAKLDRTMGTLVVKRLEKLHYESNLDVRSAPTWPSDKPVLLIAGESGVGKTWQLGNLLQDCTDKGRIATVVTIPGNGKTLLDHAVQDIWQFGLVETTNKSIVALSHHLRELDYSTPELVIAVDDVRDSDTARYLISQDWTDLRMRLVLTVPNEVASSFQGENDVEVHTVNEFSVQELQQVLEMASHKWTDLPHDLKNILRKPILAGIFTSLERASFREFPQSEYEIFEQFWQRLNKKADPHDIGVVTVFADYLFTSASRTSISQQCWSRIGLTVDQLERLEATGWLRYEEGFISFAHDRLLNWALAKWLVNAYSKGELSITDLLDSLVKAVNHSSIIGPTRFGYVPMDTLWLFAKNGENRQFLAQLVVRLEKSQEFGSYGEQLYTHLLPTLGAYAVPIFLQRLCESNKEEEQTYRATLIGKGFIALASQSGVELQETLIDLLESRSEISRNVALQVLTQFPIKDSLQTIWALHQRRQTDSAKGNDSEPFEDDRSTFNALRSTIPLNPEWLRLKLTGEDVTSDCLSELIYLLKALDHTEAQDIWNEKKNLLMSYDPPVKPRSLLLCIARFSDHECLYFVLKHLSQSDDFSSGTAFYALTILDPICALKRINDVDPFQLYISRKWWLPRLLHKHPVPTRRRILELAQQDTKEFMRIRDIFHECPNQIGETILDFLLQTLKRELRESLEVQNGRTLIWLSVRLDFLNSITRPSLLGLLESANDSELENLLVEVTVNQLEESAESTQKREIDSVYRTLLIIGGEGFSTLLRCQLSSDSQKLRSISLRWAAVCNKPEIAPDVVNAVSLCNRGDNLNHQKQRFFSLATTILAQLDADEALVEVIETTGLNSVSVKLPWLRSDQKPMSKQITLNAKNILTTSAHTVDHIIPALIVASVSRDPDFIVPVRNTLRTSDPSGLVARYACIALNALNDTSDDFVIMACKLLKHEESARFALPAIVNAGEYGLVRIRRWLEFREASTYGPLEFVAIRCLYQKNATRLPAIEIAAKACLSSHALLDPPFEIAAESNNADLLDRIRQTAFDTDALNDQHCVRAIEGLVKFDIALARSAAVQAMQRIPVIRGFFRLLDALISKELIQSFIDTAITTNRSVLRQWIGRMLRRFDIDEISDQIIFYLKQGNSQQRKAAAETAGWIVGCRVTNTIDDLAINDSSDEVRQASLAAIYAHNDEMTVRDLLAKLALADSQDRWRLLMTILKTGDPYLLADPNDSLFVFKVLSNLPPAFKFYAQSVLSEEQHRKDGQDRSKDLRERVNKTD